MSDESNVNVEANRVNFVRFAELVNNGEFDALDELVDTSKYVGHTPFPAPAPGLQGEKQVYATVFAALPDIRFNLEEVLAEGDMVAGRGTIGGTHTGAELFGVPASGKRIQWTGIDVARFENGKIVERWLEADALGIMQQLGLVPAAGEQAQPSRDGEADRTARVEQNKQIMRRMIDEVWNKGNFMVADELFAPEHRSPSAPDLPPGPESVKLLASMFRSAMPDYHMDIDLLLADETKVVARFTQSGTHTGAPLLGMRPSGRKATWTEIGVLRVDQGKVVESWYEVDMLSMMNQLNPQPQRA